MPELIHREFAPVTMTLLLLARSPGVLINPAFSYEDGRYFYISTYFSSPLTLLTTPYAGSLQTGPQLAAYLERLVSPANAPIVGSFFSLLTVMLIAGFLASSRMASLIPNSRLRLLLALGFLLLPGGGESYGRSYEVNFYLAFWMLLLVLATPARSALVSGAERVLLVVAALSGPFSTLLAPLFVIRACRERSRNAGIAALIVSVGGLIQLAFIIAGRTANGGSYSLFDYLEIIASHLVIQPFIGTPLLIVFEATTWPPLIALLAVIIFLGFLINAAARLPRGPVLTLLYGGAVIALAGIASNNTGRSSLLDAVQGQRYFLVWGAVVGGIVVAAAFAPGKDRLRRGIAIIALTVLGWGVLFGFRIGHDYNPNWAAVAACIGGPTPCVVQVLNSPGLGWDIYWPGTGASDNPGASSQPSPSGENSTQNP